MTSICSRTLRRLRTQLDTLNGECGIRILTAVGNNWTEQIYSLTAFLLPSLRGMSGPHDAGHYNSSSWETGFFISQGGSWSTPYGHFFLSWYSGLLWNHAERVLTEASDILNRTGRPRVFKALKEVSKSPNFVFAEFTP